VDYFVVNLAGFEFNATSTTSPTTTTTTTALPMSQSEFGNYTTL
jgi:hypothetical protein